MKSLFSVCALLLAASFALPVSAQATSTTSVSPAVGTKAPVAPPVNVAPGEQKTAHGVKVTNGNYAGDFPQYAGSTGDAKIKKLNGGGGTEVKTENGFKGQIDDLSAGETVVVASSNNPVTVNGNGGSVSVGSGAVVTVNNAGGTGSGNIVCTTPGGSTISVPPGVSGVVITG